MEILNQFSKNGYFTSSLYHLVAHKKMMPGETEIIPSVYLKEMKMSAQERIQNLNGIEIDNVVSGEKNMKPVLEFTPRIIVFQNYEANDKIIAKFTVKNRSTISTCVNVVIKESSNFFIKNLSNEKPSRLAPGIAMTYVITFMPHRYEDYAHSVSFITDKQKYVVPIIGMGPRPMMAFPDEIVIPPTPLKVENYVFMYPHNAGSINASYTITAKCPFSVKPKFCHDVHPKDKVEAKVTFKSMHLGESKGKLYISMETDERFVIKVSGSTYTVNIELEKAVVRFLDTYNTMVRQQVLKITNKSDQIISYMCMKNDSIFSDFHDKIKLATIFYDVKDSEAAKHRKLEQYEVISSEEHERVYTRIFSDEIQSLVADETLYFNDLNFSIMPIKGNLWPNKTTEITLTFSPKEIGDVVSVAYLDIDGIMDRVPLTMQGTSLPPNIHLHVEHLDMDCVYINKTYRYEIVAINKGHINGVIEYREVPPLFGSVITCIPEKYCLRPGDKEAFVVSFLNSNQGPYFEELNFVIRDTNIVRKLFLKGTVVYPTITFSIPCLDFGYVNVGVPKSLQLDVINESEVNVNATLKISSDGPEVSSVTLEDCEACDNVEQILALPQWPKEFNIEPTKIIMTANSRVTVRVTLTANLVRANQTAMELELEKSDSAPITIPISFDAQVPEITIAPDIKLRACFLDFTYNYDVVVSSNEYWGYFVIEEPKEMGTLQVDVGIKRGTIKPNTTISLPVSIMTAVLGPHEHIIRMYLFGLTTPIDICRITVLGVRPIVTINPMSLHWGHLKLLNRGYKTLTLANDSPVTVNFKAAILYHDGRWTIEPAEGYIEPEGETDLTVSVCLIDANTYTNKAVIHLEKVKDILVPLSAIGIGTSIVVGKDRDHVDLGRHFIKLPLSVIVPLQNCGTRMHSLEWNAHYKAPKNKKLPVAFFNIEPRSLKMAGGEITEMKILGLSSKVGVIKETWYLVGSVEGVNKKELLMECEITAEFVEPKVILSSTEINLQYDYGPYSEFYKLLDILTIKNVSKLPLHIDISIRQPFAIVRRNSYKIDPEDVDMCCCITYDEADTNLQRILNEAESRESQEFLDCITKKPIPRHREAVQCKNEGHLHFFQDIHKIRLAFEFTHVIDELLEDEEVMKLQIVFDITKHLTLKSKVYGDIMRIKFRGHKNKDIVKITGKINFPNVVIFTPKIDFGCISNGSMASKTIKIQNPTGLLVCYKFAVKKWSVIGVKVPELPELEYVASKVSGSKISKTIEEVPVVEDMPDVLAATDVDLEQEKNMLEGSPSSIKDEAIETITIQDSEMEFQIKKLNMLKKIAPMLTMEKEPEFQWAHKFNKKIKYNSNVEINELIQVIPHYGLLRPNEIQFIQVIFRPVTNISLRAVLECRVLGGPSEYITVHGLSSDLIYKLNSHTLNFKIRSFHEKAIENLIITNLAQLVFEYKTYLNEPVFSNELPAKICEIIPPEKMVEAEEEIEVAVVVKPGVMGYFERKFLLEIGYLPHISIEVFGWGVIPQIHFNLPRPGMAKLVEFGYTAISKISLDYLSAVSEILARGTTEHLNSPQTEKCFEDPDFQEEWHICSAWDGYPTVMDIDMAIERLLVIKHISSRPEIMNMYMTANRVGPIPGFQTVPYLVDFGVVITGNSVTCVIDVTNYGPIPIKMHFEKNFYPMNWLNIKLCGKLNPGETNKIEMTLAPSTTEFPEYERYIDMTFNLEVPYGVSIPINVKALCAVPFLKSNISILDLGSVRCGDKIIASVPLTNVGKPTCIWYVTLKLRTHGPNPMTILDNSGKYEPGEGGWLSVSFKPTMEMVYEGVLIFRFHMNPTRMEIPVVGQGIFPHPHIIGPNVNFPPTLPWAETTEIFFGITNLCPFPIELIIAHVDQKWKEEEELYNLLFRYYNKPEEMLVPAVKPGEGMPSAVEEFFYSYKINVKKGIDEEAAAAAKQSIRGPAKKAKSPKKSAKIEKVDKETSPIRKIRTDAEVISDTIKAMKEDGLDPIKECLSTMEEEQPPVDKYANGLLVFFHGSPCEETYAKEMAYTLGMKLGLPTINFDACFIDALCVSQCVAKTIIMTALNENLESLRRSAYKENSPDDENSAEDPYAFSEFLDEFEIVTKKLELFQTNKNIGTPRSKGSDKKKKDVSSGASQLVMGTTTSVFQMDLIIELLTDYFSQERFQCGFILDSLTSNMVKIPMLVLTTVLKCKDTIYNLHLILCQSDFATWAQNYEDALREAELAEERKNQVIEYNEEQIEEIVTDFEEMDGDDYENADPDLKAIYIKNGLEERRRRFLEKTAPPVPEVPLTKKEKSKDANQAQSLQDDGKKKLKKEDPKGKLGIEYFIHQTKYNEYQKNVYDYLIQVTNNWIIEECDLGFPLIGFNGAVLGTVAKKSKKVKSETQVITDSEPDIDAPPRGFPLTIIMHPCLQYKEALVSIFDCPFIEKKIKGPEKLDLLQLPVKRQEYTVLLPKTMPTLHYEEPLQWRFLDENPIKKCDCNQITDLNLLDDTTQDNVLNILSKWHCVCGKKVTSSQTSTSDLPLPWLKPQDETGEEEEDPFFYPLPLHSVPSITAPEGRLVLEPGDLVRCKYAFSPTLEGHFNIKRYVEVAGWPESRVDINISGICDLPRLDNRPKKMFANFVRRTQEDEVYKLTFLDDLNKFEFGPIFVGANRIYEEEYTIELKNASLLRTDVDIEFQDPTDIFEIDKNFISLEPGCRGQLKVTAAPPRSGDHLICLLFCIKDNPETVNINISCSGVLPIAEVLPLTKLIDYGKHLLYRREDDRFIVKNDSILPIMWKVRNPEDFVEDFILSRTTGIVPRHDNHVVPVTYIACNVGIISQMPMIIDIYDELGRGEPMLVDSIWLSAECYDVMVECAYENANESYLNFGNVKVNSTVYRELFLLNRGKYNIYYKMKKVKNFPEPALLKSFECDPDCGIVLPALKLVAVEFQCTPTTSMNLNNVPAYTCSLLDGSKDQVVVAKFPVPITIASFYNTFTLFPLGELNFHIIAVGSGVMRDVILNNTSKCPFNYEIVVPEKYRVEPEEQVLPLPKDKSNKLKNPPIKCGNFLIVNEDNLLAPGDSRTIPIQFLATEARTFEETIHFIVSDTCPAEAQGVPLKLVGTGAMPVLDFWNLENTFREHIIVKTIDEYKVPESLPHCVFVEDTVTLHFFCVTVNTSYTAKIDLYNNGVVACILTMKMLYQPNTNEDIFSLDKYEMQIDPLMHKGLNVTFSPKELLEYRAVLEVKLKLLYNQEQTFQFCLIGEGIIPRIRMIKPPFRQHRLALLTFPVTCLGSTSFKNIKFKNIATVNCTVSLQVLQAPAERAVFWIVPIDDCRILETEKTEYLMITVMLKPNEIVDMNVYFSPLVKGRTNCDIKIKIELNPFEYYTVMCEAEAFIEDVILMGLEMLSMDFDIDAINAETGTAASAVNSNDATGRKKSKSARTDKQKTKDNFPLGPDGEVIHPVVLKYLLDFGGCEICSAHKRSVVMLNNSERVYKFVWEQLEQILIKPAVGYISPSEEKDIEIMFYSALPVNIKRELIVCNLMAISDEDLTLDSKGATWDNRQVHTLFEFNADTGQNERVETLIDDPSSDHAQILGFKNILILYSATTEYTKYLSDLRDETTLSDTYIYQKREFDFKVENIGSVPMKISWNFFFEDEYPGRIDRRYKKEKTAISESPTVDPSMDESNNRVDDNPSNKGGGSKETLFSGSVDRYSVDTWFEVDTPFKIEPKRACLNPHETQIFKVTFSPLDVFDFTVRLRSTIDNLDPYDQNLSCKIKARSLVPYVHLDLEESDYLSRRKSLSGMVLPEHIQILEFQVLGSGCYKKTFQVINPTSEAYEFVFSPVLPEQRANLTSKDFIPVHCDKLKGYLEGGTSTPVTFTFAPTCPRIYESQWTFKILRHNLTIPLMVVGIVREPNVSVIPSILVIKNSLVGFTSVHSISLKNTEDEPLSFEFKGDSLVNESGKTIVVVRPKSGVLKPRAETSITIYYTPIQDGPISFKIFFRIQNMTKDLTLCVKALSHLVKPTVTYYIIGNEHKLDHDVVTNIHLEQTASSYERTIPFKIKNDGSTAFAYEWNYVVASVKKYLTVSVEPRTGYVVPAAEAECILHFNLKTVPVQAYPVTLTISDGPLFQIYLYAEIEKPLYHFSCKEYDFGKCIINAPHHTYKKNLAFTNDDKVPITLDLATDSKAELYVDYRADPVISPKQRAKIPIYFRPNAVQQYEFKLQFWVNSLCEEIITIRGEGVPLLVDLYEGCQKSFDLGPVKVGEKIVRVIEVMNHSKVPIDCKFVFKEVYPVISKTAHETESLGSSICLDPNSPALQGRTNTNELSRVQCVKLYRDEQKEAQIEMDIANALASVKVIPNKATIKPHMKIPLKVLFKPAGLISELNIQLNVVVLEIIRPLVLLSGSATGMSLCFSQNSLQFGRVRKRGAKILKVMLYNKGDFGAKFCWQPLISDEFTISPMQGYIDARQNVTFSITFRPQHYNPFVKIWASLNIENYSMLELALYAACVDVGTPQNQSIYIECPVREVKTEYVIITNPTDETWFVLSEFSAETPSFETLREFYIEANSVFEIPIHFKPKTFGTHEAQVLFSPLGESALFVTLIGVAVHPNPNGVIDITVEAKKSHTEPLLVYNITEKPELYIVSTELVKLTPDKFDGYYEIKYPDTVRVWGEAKATCMFTYISFEACEMILKVMFVNEDTREYQFYVINVTVKPSEIAGTVKFMCRARESVQQELTITNPLAKDADFNIISEKLHCAETIHINRNSEAKLTMTYSPLVVGEFEDTLTVENYLIGVYTYRVIAICKPAKEKLLEYSTPLGTIIPIRLRICNKSNTPATFIASTSHPSIILERNYELNAFEKGKFLIWFEPSELGVQNPRVVFNSDVAGEFVFKITGIATEPKPLGPYEIRGGSYTYIKFKNVFDDTRTFRIFVDREDFTVKTQMEQIKPKKEIRVQVYLTDKPAHGWAEPPTGCLTIENFDPIEPKVQWTYFLKGIP